MSIQFESSNMTDKCGLLLVNLGSPDAPETASVRRYLAEFLHDPRVIDTSRWIWCPILHGVILRVRPSRSAKAYAKIWGEGKEAPLIRITREQASAIQERLGNDVIVDIAMRYGQPSIGLAIDRMMAKGCSHIAVFPLYPQFAGATTASVYDGVAKALKKRMNMPVVRFLRDYYREPGYLKALACSIEEAVENADYKPDVILTSYHGLPQSYVDKGDPYQGECIETTELLKKELSFTDIEVRTTFQSRFGPKAWLQPYTDKTLEALPGEGKKKVMVVTPGFSADCLETLEEIAMEARESFEEAGGERFTYIPCLNDRDDHMDAIADIARRELLAGWLNQPHNVSVGDVRV